MGGSGLGALRRLQSRYQQGLLSPEVLIGPPRQIPHGCWKEASAPHHTDLPIALPQCSGMAACCLHSVIQDEHDDGSCNVIYDLASEVTIFISVDSNWLHNSVLFKVGRGLHKGVNIRRWGILGIILESGYTVPFPSKAANYFGSFYKTAR